jgi:hypothetical protein
MFPVPVGRPENKLRVKDSHFMPPSHIISYIYDLLFINLRNYGRIAKTNCSLC